MKRCSKCKASTDASEFRKNAATKDGLQNVCKVCHKVYCIAWKLKNPKLVAKQMRANYLKNQVEWIRYSKDWRLKNPAKAAKYSKKRALALVERTPKWLKQADWLVMNNVYYNARKLTKMTGIKHEVDHIVPLQGKDVSGLHVPWNLQVLTKEANASKSNMAAP